MRICLLSDYAGVCDEGLRNIAYNFYQELSKRHEVLHVQVRKLSSRRLLGNIKGFKPDILHFIPGPTIKSFMIVRLLSVYMPKAKTVMSAARPLISPVSTWLIPLLKPSIVLTQSMESEAMFSRLGCRVHFMPSGVDVEKFKPNDGMSRQDLRRKYGFKGEKPLLLHVGSLTKRRNVALLSRIRREMNVDVLIVSTSSTPAELDVERFLRETGCHIIKKYVRSMGEIYSMVNCYVFPVMQPSGSIEIPLTVLEAMACNIPVVTTRFGALPRLFKEDEGFLYADNIIAFIKQLKRILEKRSKVRNREKVTPYTWENVTRSLEHVYNEVLKR